MKPCIACPFRDGETEEATTGQNLGCLPTQQDMLERLDERGEALSCHDNQNIPCKGLSQHRDTTNAPVIRYSDWYHRV